VLNITVVISSNKQKLAQCSRAWAADAAARASKIIVDHLDADPTELTRAIRKPILPELAFSVERAATVPDN